MNTGLMHIHGIGKVAAIPDVADISANIESRNKSSAEAIADNSSRMELVYDAITKLGIERNQIKTTGFTVRPRYKIVKDQQTDVVDYWSVTNSITVKVTNLKILGDLLSVAGKYGSVQGPWFSCSNVNDLEDACRELAIKDAARKAKIYCAHGGLAICGIAEIVENNYGGNRSMAHSFAACGGTPAAPPIEAGEQQISISVAVQYIIKAATKAAEEVKL